MVSRRQFLTWGATLAGAAVANPLILVGGRALLSSPNLAAAAQGTAPGRRFLGVMPVDSSSGQAELASEDAYIRYEAATRTWLVGNDQIERRLRVADNRLSLVSLLNKRSGREWAPPDGTSPEFQVQLADPNRTVSGAGPLNYLGHRLALHPRGGPQLELIFDEPTPGLRLHQFYRVAPGTAAIEQWVEAENRGRAMATLAGCVSLRSRLAPQNGRLLAHSVNRGVLESWGLGLRHDTVDPGATLTLFSGEHNHDGTNRYWEAIVPWLVVEDPAKGEGLFTGCAWTGWCQLALGTVEGSRTWLVAGLDSDLFRWGLPPGERFEAPHVFVGCYRGTLDRAVEATHAYVERCLARPAPQADWPLAVSNTWYHTWDRLGELSEELCLREIERAAEAGLEAFVLDTGWAAQLGDWQPHPDRFPNGLARISDYARKRGLRFGLWIAPGIVHSQSRAAAVIKREHPEWLMRVDGLVVQDEFYGKNMFLRFGHPEARQYVFTEMARCVREYGVDWLKYDYLPLSTDDGVDGPGSAGGAVYANVRGWYSILDQLSGRYPKLILENCSGGGTFIDYGLIQRAHVFQNSDFHDPFTNLVLSYGASHPFPARYGENYLADYTKPPAGMPAVTDTYMLRSTMLGGWTLGLRLSSPDWAGNPTRWATFKQHVATYKRLRPLIVRGVVDHLLPEIDRDAPHAQQFRDPQTEQAAVFAFGGAQGGLLVVRPRNLIGNRRYRARLEDRGDYGIRTGSEWMKDGVAIGFNAPFDAEIVNLVPA